MVNSVVIVLGAASTKEGQASPCLIRRTLSGCDYARQKDGVALMVCGGQTNPHHRLKEADIMAELAENDGFPDELIIREGQSRNTLENAIFAKRLIDENGWDDVNIVTDPIHLLRAKMVFGVLGVTAKYLPAHREPKAGLSALLSIPYELTALIWYGIRLISGHHKQYRKSK